MRRLLLYVCVIGGVLAATEALLRWRRGLFLGASHRATFKAANYVARGGSAVAFFGSSRTADGILPAVVGHDAYNLAISSTSIDVLEWLAETVPPPRVAVIEVSPPQSLPRRPQWLPPEDDRVAPYVALVALRRVFRFDSLARLLGTAFASRFDGSEVTGAEFVDAVLNGHTAARGTGVSRTEVSASEQHDPMSARYLAVAKRFSRTIFYVPPSLENEDQDALLGELARTHPVWRMTAGEALFRDKGHLNKEGAAAMSAVFADALQ